MLNELLETLEVVSKMKKELVKKEESFSNTHVIKYVDLEFEFVDSLDNLIDDVEVLIDNLEEDSEDEIEEMKEELIEDYKLFLKNYKKLIKYFKFSNVKEVIGLSMNYQKVNNKYYEVKEEIE